MQFKALQFNKGEITHKTATGNIIMHNQYKIKIAHKTATANSRVASARNCSTEDIHSNQYNDNCKQVKALQCNAMYAMQMECNVM